MIIQYFDYKRKKSEELGRCDLSREKYKENCYLKKDSEGRIVVGRKVSDEIIALIEEKKIPLIIDKHDLEISLDVDMPNSEKYEGKIFRSIGDIVAIHKTPVPPNDDMIITQENSGLTKQIVFKDPSTMEEHFVPYVVGNDTIHFSLNCSVKNHKVGNDWNSYKYAVMIGLDKLDKSKILDVKSEDTYIDGNAELGDHYYIFCPLGEKEAIHKSNPKATIIEYDGISLNEAIDCMIIYSGKKLEPYGSFGWGRDSEFSKPILDNVLLNELLALENYPNLKGEFGAVLHSETKYMARRMWKREYEAIIALVEYNKKNNIDMPDEVMIMILMFGGVYSLPGSVPVSIESYKEYVFPILEKHGYQVSEELFDGIELSESGMKYIYKYYAPEYDMEIPAVQCPEWENELRARVVRLLKSYSKKIR